MQRRSHCITFPWGEVAGFPLHHPDFSENIMIDRLRHHLLDPTLWALREIPALGSIRGFAPSGRWLSRTDLPTHPAFHYASIYPESRIAFSAIDLPPSELAVVEAASREDDWANEIRPGFVARLPSGRIAQRDHILTPTDDFYSELRFPHISFVKPSDLHALVHPRYGRPNKLPGRALVLNSLGNLYHFLFEAVARIAMASRVGLDVHSFDWFVSDAPSTSFEHKILSLLGVDPARFVRAEADNSHLAFDEIVFSNTTYGIPSELCHLLREVLRGLEPNTPQCGLPKKIYISRGKAYTTRRTQNEDEVESLVRRFGFTLFLPHEHSLNEQRAVFENADTILSVHGAALANLLWCRPGTTVIEMRNIQHVRGYWKLYWNLGSALSLRYHWLNCTPVKRHGADKSAQYDDLYVPLDRLELLLAQTDLVHYRHRHGARERTAPRPLTPVTDWGGLTDLRGLGKNAFG